MDNAVNKGVCNDFSNLLGTYEEHKIYTYKIIDLLKNDYSFRDFGSSDRRYFDMLNCGTSLHFMNSDDVWYLVGANFCRQRICPMCQYRKAIKTFVQMSKVVDYLKDDYRFLHLVLTVPNVTYGDELMMTIKELYKGYNKMMKYKDCKAVVKGAMRCLEISYNYDNDTFHPHLHCLIAVNPSYFNDGKKYIKYDKWRELWSRAMGSDVLLQVSVRAIKEGDYKGVAEVCKYCVKPLNLDKGTDMQNTRVLLTLWHTLKGVRFVQRYGCIKDAFRLLNLDNDDNIDGEVCIDDTDKGSVYHFEWNAYQRKYIKVR